MHLHVAALRERVYEVLRDPRRMLGWNPAMAGVDLVAGEPGVVGCR